MPQTYDLILKGGIVVNHDGRIERDVGVRGGAIAHIGDLSQASAEREINCRGLHILPGVFDTQVHFALVKEEARDVIQRRTLERCPFDRISAANLATALQRIYSP